MRCECGAEVDSLSVDCPQCGSPLTISDSDEGEGWEFEPGALVMEKYEIVRRLGQGGMGQVYLARDRKLERLIALKTLSEDFSGDEEYKARFMREARMASALNHPNILTVYEIGAVGNTLFIATEYVEGQTLRDIMDTNPLSLNKSIDIAVQVAQGLSAAHEAGIVHRDLKLENFILRRDGYLKILDFGLAKTANVMGGADATDAFKTRAGIILGTPFYMSPEQAKGLPLDARSDIFSFGVVLYELLTNTVAFDADTDMQVLFKVAFHEPPPMPDDIPQQLRDIVKRAMQKSLESRYQTMRMMLEDLIAVRDGQRGTEANLQMPDRTQEFKKASDTGKQRITGVTDRLTTSREKFVSSQTSPAMTPNYDQFVGRETEMESLRNEFQRCREGKGRPALIVGDQGSGKTQMLARFQQWAQSQGAIAASANLVDFGGNVSQPYQAYLTLLISALGIRDSDPGAAKEGDGWKRVAAYVKQRFGMEIASSLTGKFSSDDEAEKWRVFEALHQLFLRIAQEKPLALLLDNLHWADGLSLDLLGYMLRNRASAPIAVVATAGDEESSKAGEPLREWLMAQSRYATFERIKLKPFGAAEVRLALEAVFQRIEISEREISYLCEATSGNPYYLTEIIRLLVTDKKIVLGEGWWHCGSLEGMELPTSIGIAVQYKLEHCDKQVYELLSQASVLGEGFRFDTLAALVDIDEDELDKLLGLATKAFLLREQRSSQSDEYRFYNSIIQQVLYNALGKRQRRKLHAGAAEAIQEVYRNKLARVYRPLSYHFNAAGDWGHAFEFGVKALEQAWEQDSWGEVAKHAKWIEDAVAGIEENPEDYQPLDQSTLVEVKLKCAGALLRLGNIEQALAPAQSALEVAERLDDKKLIGRAKDRLCELYRYQGRFQDALKLADEGLAAAEAAGDDAYIRLLHYHRGWVSWRVMPFADALHHLGRACEMSEAADDMKVLVQARLYYGIVQHCQGNWREGTAYSKKALEMTQKLGDRFGEAMANTMLVLVNYYERDHEELTKCYEAGVALSRTVGFRIGEAYFHILKGFDYLSPTNLDINAAWDYLQRGLTICQETGEKGLQFLTWRGLAKIDSLTGQHDQAINKLKEVLAIWKKVGEVFDQAAAYCFLGEAQETADRIEDALESFKTCYELAESLPFPIWQWQALYGEARCLQRLDKTRLAIGKLSSACAIIVKLRNEFESEARAANFIRETQAVYDALSEWS